MGQVIKHYGTKRHSGRYPWGSGGEPYQRAIDFLGQVEEYQRKGMTKQQIAEAMGIKTKELIARQTVAEAAKRAALTSRAMILKETGMSTSAIGREMGINESSVRALLDPSLQARSNSIYNTADIIAENASKKRFLDVGAGMEQQLGVSRTKLDSAVILLKAEGYNVIYDDFRQNTTGHNTSLRIISPPDATFEEYKEFKKKGGRIGMIENYTEDNGLTWNGIEPINSVSRSRVHVRYGDEGGKYKDGLIELRRGVDDISLGNARYAQVRIGVDGKHFMKGMAMYTDTIPDGKDIVYNTNKNKGTPDDDVFKKIKKEDDPFGAVIRQKHYIDSDGKSKLSALNIVGSRDIPGSGEEGSWKEWSRTLSSQFLSKQSRALAKKQLEEALSRRQEEYEEIMSLTNPTVKKRLLESFGDNCDAAAVHLKAAAMPRQVSHVILPLTTVKEHEVYAPRYRDGEVVVLIRHPHGGTFEIPQLIVNNKNREARSSLGDAADAIGIHWKVAEKLSGADFDGDTVLVIPNRDGAITSKPSLRALADFQPREQYKKYEGMPVMTPHQKGVEMGKISNLITDMTIKGANDNEIAMAVRHSMVVIDAEKHELNYKQSEKDHNIAFLKTKYQGGPKKGAATLISKAGSQEIVPHRKQNYRNIDPATGKRIYEPSGETYVKTGSYVKDKRTGKYIIDPATGERMRKELRTPKIVARTMKSTKMAETDDAFTLSSGSKMEEVYASYANSLKTLANRSRKASVEIKDILYSPSAREVYDAEVRSLVASLNIAKRNKPYERQAQLYASAQVRALIRENPDMDDDHIKKISGQALTAARLRVGAGKEKIKITDREWEAIQAGAITPSRLREILLNADLDAIKERSMPRSSPIMSPTRLQRVRNMRNNGADISEIAQALGVSNSTIERALNS